MRNEDILDYVRRMADGGIASLSVKRMAAGGPSNSLNAPVRTEPSRATTSSSSAGKVTNRGPTGGPLNAPSRTAPSSGTGNKGSNVGGGRSSTEGGGLGGPKTGQRGPVAGSLANKSSTPPQAPSRPSGGAIGQASRLSEQKTNAGKLTGRQPSQSDINGGIVSLSNPLNSGIVGNTTEQRLKATESVFRAPTNAAAAGYDKYKAPEISDPRNQVNALRDVMQSRIGFADSPFTRDMDKTVRHLAGEVGISGVGSGQVANTMINRTMANNYGPMFGVDEKFNNNLDNREQWGSSIANPNFRMAKPGSDISGEVANRAVSELMGDGVGIPAPNATDFRAVNQPGGRRTQKTGVDVAGNRFGNFSAVSGDEMAQIRGATNQPGAAPPRPAGALSLSSADVAGTAIPSKPYTREDGVPGLIRPGGIQPDADRAIRAGLQRQPYSRQISDVVAGTVPVPREESMKRIDRVRDGLSVTDPTSLSPSLGLADNRPTKPIQDRIKDEARVPARIAAGTYTSPYDRAPPKPTARPEYSVAGMSFTPGLPAPQRVASGTYTAPYDVKRQAAGTYTAPYDVRRPAAGTYTAPYDQPNYKVGDKIQGPPQRTTSIPNPDSVGVLSGLDADRAKPTADQMKPGGWMQTAQDAVKATTDALRQTGDAIGQYANAKTGIKSVVTGPIADRAVSDFGKSLVEKTSQGIASLQEGLRGLSPIGSAQAGEVTEKAPPKGMSSATASISRLGTPATPLGKTQDRVPGSAEPMTVSPDEGDEYDIAKSGNVVVANLPTQKQSAVFKQGDMYDAFSAAYDEDAAAKRGVESVGEIVRGGEFGYPTKADGTPYTAEDVEALKGVKGQPGYDNAYNEYMNKVRFARGVGAPGEQYPLSPEQKNKSRAARAVGAVINRGPLGVLTRAGAQLPGAVGRGLDQIANPGEAVADYDRANPLQREQIKNRAEAGPFGRYGKDVGSREGGRDPTDTAVKQYGDEKGWSEGRNVPSSPEDPEYTTYIWWWTVTQAEREAGQV